MATAWQGKRPDTIPAQVEFQQAYQAIQRAAVIKPAAVADQGERFSQSWEKESLPVVLHWLARRGQCSIVAENSLDGVTVSLDLFRTTIGEAMGIVARRLGVDITHSGNVYYLGKLRPQDRAFLVRRVRALSDSDLVTALDVLKSSDGQGKVLPGGVVVLADRVEVLQRASDMLDTLETASAESAQWCVQLVLITTSDTFLEDLGISGVPTIDLAATYAAASAGSPASRADLKASFNAMLRATRSTGGAQVVAQPLLLLHDGTTSTFQRGQRVPIAKRAVSDQGTVTTTGFDYEQTGLVIQASVREVTYERGALAVKVTLSNIDKLTDEGAPLTSQSSLEGKQEVESGGVYLLGSLDLTDVKQSQDVLFQIGRNRSDEHHRFQLWARVLRVGGPASRFPSASESRRETAAQVEPEKTMKRLPPVVVVSTGPDVNSLR